MINAAGWRVEPVTVHGSAGCPPDHKLRVTWRGYWQADCHNTAEVAEHVDLATLVPEGWAHVRPLIRPSNAGLRASRRVR
jgi:hypothetical protein